MDINALLADALGRVHEQVPHVVGGLGEDDLAWRPEPEANSIGWLIWHLTRVLDDHVAEVAGLDQVWTSAGWFERFGLPFPVEAHGYGHSSDDVAAVRVSAELLIGYHAAVAEMAQTYVVTLTADDLDRIVDERWDPPVTLGVRLVSVIDDLAQHIGQAAYVRGMIDRR